MKTWITLLALCVSGLSLPTLSHADEEYFGKLENRPDSKAGTWTVGGRQFMATEETELEEEHGMLKMGACVEVEYENNKVEEIESKPMARCP